MPRKIREIRIEGNVAYVPLTKGYEAKIDVDDVPLVGAWNWHANIGLRSDGSVRYAYAMRTDTSGATPKNILMHRALLPIPEPFLADHINGNGLDNRKANIRIATKSQNQHNRGARVDSKTGVKGVVWHRPSKKWCATIWVNSKQHKLGLFRCITAAALAYARASAELHGEFGRVG